MSRSPTLSTSTPMAGSQACLTALVLLQTEADNAHATAITDPNTNLTIVRVLPESSSLYTGQH